MFLYLILLFLVPKFKIQQLLFVNAFYVLRNAASQGTVIISSIVCHCRTHFRAATNLENVHVFLQPNNTKSDV